MPVTRHIVGRVSEVPPGQRKIVEVEGRSIGVFNVHGTFYALRNTCPHQGGPLCLGSIKGMTLPSAPGEYLWAREGEILRCPWHGWEFDLTTGRAICEPERTRVRTYPVTVEPAEPTATELLAAETYPVTVEADCIVLHL
jgi:3-phenylpropionate/trans-cinnamate dioxygenase ferredoxin subunit